MKKLVISGINLFKGGTLSIYYDCLDNLIKNKIYEEFEITIFVHKKELFEKYKNFINIIELPKSRKNYLYRLYYEYFYFYKYSKNKDIDIWISLHDITPKVKSKKLYTYCQNPSPFIKNIKYYSFKDKMFTLLYKYLYRINIKSNDAVIVQQEWIRQEFKKMYPIKNVIVANPNININFNNKNTKKKLSDKKSFIYPAFPRFFKNFEVICEAVEEVASSNYEIWLTIDGSENKYAKELFQKYGHNPNIKWLGIKTREEIFELYNQADYLIFPSLMETWGLPISEFKETDKPIILADVPYAHETLGKYDKTVFFNPYNKEDLKKIIKDVCENKNIFKPHNAINYEKPYALNWNELFEIIL